MRVERGVSAVGNVVAFNTFLRPQATVGAFNDRARGVWAWAFAKVPDRFHPRKALERWYRYHLFEDLPLRRLRAAAAAFQGIHTFDAFTSDPHGGPPSDLRIAFDREDEALLVDVRARSFRRGMVRRIVAALVAHARQEVSVDEIRAALRGERRDFGTVPPEPLVLMDVRYEIPFQPLLKPKVRDEWRRMQVDAKLRLQLLGALQGFCQSSDR